MAPPVPQRGLTTEKVADAIRRVVGDVGMTGGAEELGRHVRAERGAVAAVDALREICHERVGAPKGGQAPRSPGV